MLADVSPHSKPLFRFSHKKLKRSRKGTVYFFRDETIIIRQYYICQCTSLSLF
jgi:hypothetical protein